jgi:hypothetical protein
LTKKLTQIKGISEAKAQKIQAACKKVRFYTSRSYPAAAARSLTHLPSLTDVLLADAADGLHDGARTRN